MAEFLFLRHGLTRPQRPQINSKIFSLPFLSAIVFTKADHGRFYLATKRHKNNRYSILDARYLSFLRKQESTSPFDIPCSIFMGSLPGLILYPFNCVQGRL